MSSTPDSTTAVDAEQVEAAEVESHQAPTARDADQDETEQADNVQATPDEPGTTDPAQGGDQESGTGTDAEADSGRDLGAGDASGAEAGSADEAGAPAGSRGRTEDLVREGEVAADFLEALLDIADLSGDLEVDIEGNRAAVAIVDSEDGVAPRRLVGPGGTVLDALQELTRLAVQAETGERSRLMLDVAGYRSDRRAALVKTAREAIEEVRESGSRRELEPMTAFERKVVHDEVLAAGLRSESEGAEPSRYVVIEPSA